LAIVAICWQLGLFESPCGRLGCSERFIKREAASLTELSHRLLNLAE